MIEIRQEPFSEELKNQLYSGFARHALETIGYESSFEHIAFIASEHTQFAGAIVIRLFWGALHITHLYLEAPYRGKRLGTKLLERAFSYAKEHHCRFAFVETMSFQAKGFYEKLGFVLEITRSGYDHGISMHYLRKNFCYDQDPSCSNIERFASECTSCCNLPTSGSV